MKIAHKTIRVVSTVVLWSTVVSSSVIAGHVYATNQALQTPIDKLFTKESIEGSFHQYKYLPNLPQPLLSNGYFRLRAGESVLWQVQQPVQRQFQFTLKHLQEAVEIEKVTGQMATGLSAEEMLKILTALLNGDRQQLEQDFAFTSQTQEDQWQVTLVPRNSMYAQFIDKVEIVGSAYIDEMTLYQGGKLSTSIKFSGIKPLLSSQE